jgi:hypothetical protein
MRRLWRMRLVLALRWLRWLRGVCRMCSRLVGAAAPANAFLSAATRQTAIATAKAAAQRQSG